jgi:hypothetical protein
VGWIGRIAARMLTSERCQKTNRTISVIRKGQRCGYPGLDASSWWRRESSAAGGYDGRDDADDALRLNRQVLELEPRALRPILVPMLR